MNRSLRIVLLVLALAATLAIHLKVKRLEAPPESATRFSAGPREEEPSRLVGREAPRFALADLRGETVALESLRGETVVLNFFTTWCGPCRMEMPDLVRFAAASLSRGVRVVGIDVQESAREAEPFAREMGLNFPVLVDAEGSVSGSYGVEAYPTTVLIDAAGVVRAVNVGMIADFDEWYARAAAGAPGAATSPGDLGADEP